MNGLGFGEHGALNEAIDGGKSVPMLQRNRARPSDRRSGPSTPVLSMTCATHIEDPRPFHARLEPRRPAYPRRAIRRRHVRRLRHAASGHVVTAKVGHLERRPGTKRCLC